MAQPPRLLVLSAYYFPVQGGSETHAREIVTYLKRIGTDVRVVTKRMDAKGAALEHIDDVPVHRVAPAGPRTGWRKWLMLPFAFAKMLSLRREFDVIYCPGYQGIGLAAIAAGVWLGRPVVLRSGNLGVLSGRNWNAPLGRWGIRLDNPLVRWSKARVRSIYMKADALACNCRENETEALECGMPRAKVHYLPNAVNLTRFRLPAPGESAAVRAEAGWPADRLLCLYVGRLSAEKGVLDLLEAWRRVDRNDRIDGIQRPDAVLVLVGPDMTGDALDVGPQAREFVAQHGLRDRVIIHGPSSDIARLLRGADVYVQPSHYESFSNAVIEAMATGLPMVASRVGGMLDCLVDEENGLLATPKDPIDLARKLQRLLDDPALRARLGARAHETVARDFDERVLFKRFVELFQDVGTRRA